MTPSIRRSVGWLVCHSVCLSFPKGPEVSFPCSYWSTFLKQFLRVSKNISKCLNVLKVLYVPNVKQLLKFSESSLSIKKNLTLVLGILIMVRFAFDSQTIITIKKIYFFANAHCEEDLRIYNACLKDKYDY